MKTIVTTTLAILTLIAFIFPEGSKTNEINGHEYVEMGDGLKWATCNVGASVPQEFGGYYSWGETSTKKDYRWETYKWMKKGKSEWSSITKYTVKDGMTEGIWYQKSLTDSTRFEFVGGTN